MSLDVYLEAPNDQKGRRAIFVRKDGMNVEISREEWDEMFPNREPVMARVNDTDTVYHANITHNLGKMAEAAGIYEALWRPEEVGIKYASELVKPLSNGLALLEGNPEKFEEYSPSNGWGTYEGLVHFVREYMDACIKYPEASVSAWR